ncbi:hypothetical protein KC331_g3936 [Hortaea werneckii]|uniref:Glycoside hydrolase family 5 domain-containing protein n=1 Tax=Hortaea werneckii TaxID=91943 RepID=A0A3M7D417_HORWE|nr:hypothetical protein KC331_g3936 [Hortaea werneckii]KAI7718142.1 hypothetical protein KC353_g4004 [Hortaea werneckii]RMY59095.1 hypothetical protein D0865_02256 [Hortaea werneckii]
MAPVQTGPGGLFSDTFFDMYNSVGEYMSRRGAYVTVDAHNYIRYGSANRTGTDGGGTICNTSDPKAATSEQFGYLSTMSLMICQRSWYSVMIKLPSMASERRVPAS